MSLVCGDSMLRKDGTCCYTNEPCSKYPNCGWKYDIELFKRLKHPEIPRFNQHYVKRGNRK